MLLNPIFAWFFQLVSYYFNPPLFWLLVGGMLCLAELTVPTAFTLFTMGISAFFVSLLVVILPLKLGFQVALWMIFSIIFLYLTHRFMPKRQVLSMESTSEAETLTEILPGKTGRVLYEGNSWRGRCADDKIMIAAAEKIYVVGREGTTLIVMPEKLLNS